MKILTLDRFSIKIMSASFAIALMSGGMAHARYTAIDALPSGEFKYIYFSGYCDTNTGAECESTYTLPYAVSFSGRTTDQLSLRSDGTVQFVGDLLASPLNAVDRYEVLASVDTGKNSPDQIAGVGRTITEISFGPPNPPAADYTLTNPILFFEWFSCSGSGAAACFRDYHYLNLTPEAGGFHIVYNGGVNQKADEFLAARIVPKSAGAVPEPTTWALMISGFGMLGSVLRSRRRTGLQAAH